MAKAYANDNSGNGHVETFLIIDTFGVKSRIRSLHAVRFVHRGQTLPPSERKVEKLPLRPVRACQFVRANTRN